MKRILLVIAAIPIIAVAANVFIWNFDPLDRFYDTEVGDSVDCAYWLENTLADNGHSFYTDVNLPLDLSSYDAVFATLGWYRC